MGGRLLLHHHAHQCGGEEQGRSHDGQVTHVAITLLSCGHMVAGLVALLVSHVWGMVVT